jgi:hypothetical protein
MDWTQKRADYERQTGSNGGTTVPNDTLALDSGPSCGETENGAQEAESYRR